jgi:hypothetical protein
VEKDHDEKGDDQGNAVHHVLGDGQYPHGRLEQGGNRRLGHRPQQQ